jgi:aspartate/methionine/tyrosine aminotransferase
MFQVLARAIELERKGKEIVHFEIGDPDFATPDNVTQAAVEALQPARGNPLHEFNGIARLPRDHS